MKGVAKSTRDPLLDEAAGLFLRLRASPGDVTLEAERAAWCARSDRHAQAWAAAQQVWSLAGAVGPAATPVPARRRRWLVPAGAALAACLLLAFLPGLWLLLAADYTSAVGESRQVSLADGSTVLLDSDSAIAVDYEGGARGVTLLAGRAFFDVQKDPARPFLVKAGEVSVRVTGTAFDVGLEAGGVVVSVKSGSVHVGYPAGGVNAAADLSPGDRLRVSGAGQAVADRMAPSSLAAWRRGRLMVESATVGDVVEVLRRYHRGVIVIADDALAQAPVTGVFDLRDPMRALRAAVQPHAGTVHEITPWLVVLSGP